MKAVISKAKFSFHCQKFGYMESLDLRFLIGCHSTSAAMLSRRSERENVISMRKFWLCSKLQVGKNGVNFVDCRNNKKRWRTLYAFPIFPVSSNILTSLIESWCIVFVGNQFFSDKITLKTVSELFIFPRYTRNFGAKRDIIHKHSSHIASI